MRLVLVMLLSSVLLGCTGSIHVKDKKGVCLGLCVYSETDAIRETAEGKK